MFVSFLLPKIDRGAGPLYHWVMLAQMSRFRADEIAFLGDEQYFDEGAVPFGETLQIGGYSFSCPDREQFASYRKICLDSSRLDCLYDGGRNHLDVFRDVLCEPQPALVECLDEALAELGTTAPSPIEAVLTWCNCPSLNEVARSLNLPVIHNELGPLRTPLYRDTVYFDFDGVNGNTSASRWNDTVWLREQMHGAELVACDALRGMLVKDEERVRRLVVPHDRFPLGVALQVQDDSNCIAFNRDWDELHLIYDAISRHPAEQVLVRAHPHARFVYRGGLGVVDESEDSLAFLARLDRLQAINSSLLAEAALWDVRFTAKGDTPVACLAESAVGGMATGDDRTLWLNAFFLAYLVPGEALFDPEYYRWRLAVPRSLAECHSRHRQFVRPSEPVFLAGLATAPAGAPNQSPTRMAATWTRANSLEWRTLEAERKALAVRQQLDQLGGRHSQLERGYVELERRLADERHWRAEAERLWVDHEWLRNRIGELERLLGQSQGELGALRQDRQELIGKLEQAEDSRQGLQQLLAECTGNCRELEGRLAALNQRLHDMRLSFGDRVRGRLTHMP